MTDPTGHDPLLEGLAWVHPLWMLAGLALAGLGLRTGLRLRRGRLARARRAAGLRNAHLRVVKPAVALLLVGFALGPASAIWLRGWQPFDTFHAWVGALAAALFAGAAALGRGLERGRSRRFDAHALLGGLGVLLAALAAVAGFALLP